MRLKSSDGVAPACGWQNVVDTQTKNALKLLALTPHTPRNPSAKPPLLFLKRHHRRVTLSDPALHSAALQFPRDFWWSGTSGSSQSGND